MFLFLDVYETVDIQGSLDVRASATAKATVASFAASEGHVSLKRNRKFPWDQY